MAPKTEVLALYKLLFSRLSESHLTSQALVNNDTPVLCFKIQARGLDAQFAQFTEI